MTSVNESLVLGGIELNDFTSYSIDTLDMPPPPKRPEWATGADTDGAQLVRTPLFGPRTITATLRVEPQASMDTALAKLAAISDLIEEASRQPDGVTLVWTPATGTKSVTFYVLEGEITGVPIDITSGWFVKAPKFTITLTCKPFGYGPEVVGSPSSSTLPAMTVTVPSVAGDVPAEGRLIVTDAASQSRRHMEWGLEQRYYNSGTALLIDSEDLITSGYAGTQATQTGGYRRAGATNDVVSVSLTGGYSGAVALCATAIQSHIGTFRVKARVYVTGFANPATDCQIRLGWQDNDGPFRVNPWATGPVTAAGFYEVDLGLIAPSVAVSGTQKWMGRVDVRNTGATTGTVAVDYVVLVPAGEGYGKARATAISDPGVLTAQDSLAGSGSLNGRTATGGTWASAGATTDWTVAADGISRAVTSQSTPRIGTIGSASTSARVNVALKFNVAGVGAGIYQDRAAGIVVRYVDASNYVFVGLRENAVGTLDGVLRIVVAGTPTDTVVPGIMRRPAYAIIGVVVYPSGLLVGQFYDVNAAATYGTSTISTVLATGGALASGTSGVLDQNPSASAATRLLFQFSVQTPPPEPIIIYSGRTLEVRSSDTIRQDSTGTYTGRPGLYRGSRFYVPPAGSAARTSRILVKADRNDLETSPSGTRGDNLTVTVAVTPRYLTVPR